MPIRDVVKHYAHHLKPNVTQIWKASSLHVYQNEVIVPNEINGPVKISDYNCGKRQETTPVYFLISDNKMFLK